MNTRETIQFVLVQQGDVFSKDATPVWPVRDKGEYQALDSMVRSMGGKLVECTDPSPAILSGDEIVAGLGEKVVEHARLYAHLTGRKCRLAGNRHELDHIPGLAVVIALEEDLSYDLLDQLYSRSEMECAPGLIYSHTLSLLRQQVLARSAAAYLCTPVRLCRVDVFPHAPVSKFVDDDFLILGAGASPMEIREAVGANAGVLSIHTHSDGIDAFLRPDLILCPMDPEPEDAPADRPPICKITGFCHRTQQTIEVARAKNLFLAPENIAARILVLDVCWGLRPPLDVNNVAWGYTRRLLQEFRIGALLTTWEIVRPSSQDTLSLIDSLASGESVGDALAKHLTRNVNSGGDHRMCLVGDPAVALQRAARFSLAPIFPSSDHGMEQRRRMADALAFLRAYILSVCRSRHGVYEDRSQDVLVALAACEDAFYHQIPADYDTDSPYSRLRDALRNFLVGRWPVAVSTWNEFVATMRCLDKATSCWICGRPSRRFECILWTPGQPRRTTTNCPNCGFISDLPYGRDLQFEIKPGGIIRLIGDTRGAAAAVMIDSPLNRPTLFWSTAGDRSLPEIQIETPWPKGPLRIAVFVVWQDFELAVLGAGGRGEFLCQPQTHLCKPAVACPCDDGPEPRDGS